MLSGELDAALLRHVQALKLSEEEALAAFATIDAGRDPRALRRARGARHVRLQRGAAIASGEGSGQASSQAVPGVDPTGAGDAFLAATRTRAPRGRGPLEAGAAACEPVSALLAARVRQAT